MKLQTASQESIPDGFQHRLSLPLTPALDDGIIRITLELDVRERPLHPEIERVMQEEIGQQWTDDCLNATDNVGRVGALAAAELGEADGAFRSDRSRWRGCGSNDGS